MVDPFGLIGQTLDDQFRVDAVVGEGGFSAVYRGTLTTTGEAIALKCLKLTGAVMQGSAVVDQFVQRFRDESRILQKLAQVSPAVVRCIASGTTIAPVTGALVPYMVLEWLEGETLEAELTARPGPRSVAETLALLDPVFDAIAQAHTLGVVHRDLSTGNIFLSKHGAKVLDFGVAKVISDDLALGPRAATLAQIKIFSPAYAAPEQFDSRIGTAGPYTDVYSLALVTVEVLAGRTVRSSQTLGEMMQVALDPNAPRTPRALGVAVPDPVEQVLSRALSLEPARRQKDVGELTRELRGAHAVSGPRPPVDLGTTARSPGAPPTPEADAFKSTVRMSSPAQAPAAPGPPSTGQLFQGVALSPPANMPPPEPSVSVVARPRPGPSRVDPMAPPTNNPNLQMTKQPMSDRSVARAQWLVGLLVFTGVLLVGAVVLKLLLH